MLPRLYVGDLDRTFSELKAKGVQFVMPPIERGEEGIKLSVCLDPDGLPISVAQETKRETSAEMPAAR